MIKEYSKHKMSLKQFPKINPLDCLIEINRMIVVSNAILVQIVYIQYKNFNNNITII